MRGIFVWLVVAVCGMGMIHAQTPPWRGEEVKVIRTPPSNPTGNTVGAESKPEGSFEAADTNHDGVVSREEWNAYKNHPDYENIEETVKRFSSGEGFFAALWNSLAMIVATELGDKTFFIAAIMAMRHPRFVVYVGALGAVAVMTVLSVGIGFALPALISRNVTHLLSAGLFLFFGAKLLWEAREMEDGVSDELAEVEEELGSDKEKEEGGGDVDVEEGREERGGGFLERKAGEVAAWVVMTRAFTMTFVAEWGDRSQIATIALAAAKDPIGTCIGGVLGHAICTGIAVVGGRLLAARISERTVTIAGGALFIFFGIHSLFFE